MKGTGDEKKICYFTGYDRHGYSASDRLLWGFDREAGRGSSCYGFWQGGKRRGGAGNGSLCAVGRKTGRSDRGCRADRAGAEGRHRAGREVGAERIRNRNGGYAEGGAAVIGDRQSAYRFRAGRLGTVGQGGTGFQ